MSLFPQRRMGFFAQRDAKVYSSSRARKGHCVYRERGYLKAPQINIATKPPIPPVNPSAMIPGHYPLSRQVKKSKTYYFLDTYGPLTARL